MAFHLFLFVNEEKKINYSIRQWELWSNDKIRLCLIVRFKAMLSTDCVE